MLKNFALVLASVLSTAVFIGSCSDDTSGADAAACECDPAEPPLTGRIMRVEVRRTAVLAGFVETAVCPANSTLLGGGCYSEGINRRDVRLRMAGEQVPAGDVLSYGCDWDNVPGLEVTVVAWAKCLIPAP